MKSRAFILLAALLAACPQMRGAEAGHLVETRLLDPRIYPDDGRRPVKPPGWELFGNQTHFTTMRRFQSKDGRLVNFAEDFERYTKTFDLGDVIWPNARFLTASNIPEMVAEMKRRGLFLYQIWGYVPGSGPDVSWPQFRLSPETSALFESQLGDRWLGMDMGEQDGRYILGFSNSVSPLADDRLSQFLSFHRYMEGIADDLGNKTSGLAAVSWAHYYGKEGIFTMVGAETAQGHPNAQVFYAFSRGAGKQYGLPWFGNASIYNRWGYKSYGEAGKDHSSTKGTSLALLKRLLYSHLLYNCVIAGYEGGWFHGDRLSPIGQLQQAAQKWVRAHGQPGVMQTPIAVMLDFTGGWTFPSYNSVLYRVWGNLPYGLGDYLTNNILGLLYPGYQDSSFFHDESGFATATPYGDAADVLLSDAPGWILARYPVLVVAGNLRGGAEVRDKLRAYVEQGGRLFITAGSLKNLPGGLAGITVGGPAKSFAAGQAIAIRDTTLTEKEPFELLPLDVPEGAEIFAKAGEVPAVVNVSAGRGALTVFASPFGISAESIAKEPVTRPVDQAVVNPYPMLGHVARVLDTAFRRETLFEAGEGLAVITCRRSPGDYTLGISNNALAPRPFQIVSRVGRIQSIEEIPLDQSEKTGVGYLPEGLEKSDVGHSDDHTIAGGDIRIFHVCVAETGVAELPAPAPPPAPRGRFLALPGLADLQEEILSRPTFFEHFDGVSLDWKYLAVRDTPQVQREAAWLARQKVRLVVDLSSGVNLFPDLRLVRNFPEEAGRSLAAIRDVIGKMKLFGAHDLVIPLHTRAGYYSDEETREEYAHALTEICRPADDNGITVHLRNAQGKTGSPGDLLDLADRVAAPNLKIAIASGPVLSGGAPDDKLAARLKGRIGLCLVSTPRKDIAGRTWTSDAPLAGTDFAPKLAAWLQLAPEAPLIQSAVYPDQDAEYYDAVALEKVVRAK